MKIERQSTTSEKIEFTSGDCRAILAFENNDWVFRLGSSFTFLDNFPTETSWYTELDDMIAVLVAARNEIDRKTPKIG